MPAITIGTIKTRQSSALKQLLPGEKLDPGDLIYKNTSDQKHYIADATGGASESTIVGMVVTGADPNLDPNEYATVLTSGSVDLGAVLVVGETYVLGTAGGIHPIGDRVAGWYTSDLGKASATNQLDVSILNKGIVKA